MRWTDKDHCEAETGPIHWPTVVWMLIVALLCTVAPAIIEGWRW